MRRLNNVLLIVLILFSCSTAYATPSYQKSNYDKVTRWNKVTDFFATVGKSDKDKTKILRRRKYERKQIRIKKAQEKASKERLKRTKKLKSSYIHQ